MRVEMEGRTVFRNPQIHLTVNNYGSPEDFANQNITDYLRYLQYVPHGRQLMNQMIDAERRRLASTTNGRGPPGPVTMRFNNATMPNSPNVGTLRVNVFHHMQVDGRQVTQGPITHVHYFEPEPTEPDPNIPAHILQNIRENNPQVDPQDNSRNNIPSNQQNNTPVTTQNNPGTSVQSNNPQGPEGANQQSNPPGNAENIPQRTNPQPNPQPNQQNNSQNRPRTNPQNNSPPRASTPRIRRISEEKIIELLNRDIISLSQKLRILSSKTPFLAVLNKNSEVISASAESVASEDVCSICLMNVELLCVMRKLKCGHSFHKECIDKWLLIYLTCPLCRRGILGNAFEVNETLVEEENFLPFELWTSEDEGGQDDEDQFPGLTRRRIVTPPPPSSPPPPRINIQEYQHNNRRAHIEINNHTPTQFPVVQLPPLHLLLSQPHTTTTQTYHIHSQRPQNQRPAATTQPLSQRPTATTQQHHEHLQPIQRGTRQRPDSDEEAGPSQPRKRRGTLQIPSAAATFVDLARPDISGVQSNQAGPSSSMGSPNAPSSSDEDVEDHSYTVPPPPRTQAWNKRNRLTLLIRKKEPSESSGDGTDDETYTSTVFENQVPISHAQRMLDQEEVNANENEFLPDDVLINSSNNEVSSPTEIEQSLRLQPARLYEIRDEESNDGDVIANNIGNNVYPSSRRAVLDNNMYAPPFPTNLPQDLSRTSRTFNSSRSSENVNVEYRSGPSSSNTHNFDCPLLNSNIPDVGHPICPRAYCNSALYASSFQNSNIPHLIAAHSTYITSQTFNNTPHSYGQLLPNYNNSISNVPQDFSRTSQTFARTNQNYNLGPSSSTTRPATSTHAVQGSGRAPQAVNNRDHSTSRISQNSNYIPQSSNSTVQGSSRTLQNSNNTREHLNRPSVTPPSSQPTPQGNNYTPQGSSRTLQSVNTPRPSSRITQNFNNTLQGATRAVQSLNNIEQSSSRTSKISSNAPVGFKHTVQPIQNVRTAQNVAHTPSTSQYSKHTPHFSSRPSQDSNSAPQTSHCILQNSNNTPQGSNRTAQNSNNTSHGSNRTLQNSNSAPQSFTRTVQNSNNVPQGSNRILQNSNNTPHVSNRILQNSINTLQGSNRTSQISNNAPVAPRPVPIPPNNKPQCSSRPLQNSRQPHQCSHQSHNSRCAPQNSNGTPGTHQKTGNAPLMIQSSTQAAHASDQVFGRKSETSGAKTSTQPNRNPKSAVESRKRKIFMSNSSSDEEVNDVESVDMSTIDNRSKKIRLSENFPTQRPLTICTLNNNENNENMKKQYSEDQGECSDVEEQSDARSSGDGSHGRHRKEENEHPSTSGDEDRKSEASSQVDNDDDAASASSSYNDDENSLPRSYYEEREGYRERSFDNLSDDNEEDDKSRGSDDNDDRSRKSSSVDNDDSQQYSNNEDDKKKRANISHDDDHESVVSEDNDEEISSVDDEKSKSGDESKSDDSEDGKSQSEDEGDSSKSDDENSQSEDDERSKSDVEDSKSDDEESKSSDESNDGYEISKSHNKKSDENKKENGHGDQGNDNNKPTNEAKAEKKASEQDPNKKTNTSDEEESKARSEVHPSTSNYQNVRLPSFNIPRRIRCDPRQKTLASLNIIDNFSQDFITASNALLSSVPILVSDNLNCTSTTSSNPLESHDSSTPTTTQTDLLPSTYTKKSSATESTDSSVRTEELNSSFSSTQSEQSVSACTNKDDIDDIPKKNSHSLQQAEVIEILDSDEEDKSGNKNNSSSNNVVTFKRKVKRKLKASNPIAKRKLLLPNEVIVVSDDDEK